MSRRSQSHDFVKRPGSKVIERPSCRGYKPVLRDGDEGKLKPALGAPIEFNVEDERYGLSRNDGQPL
jgi:hypothetical protein